jgi:UDP-2,3-diacylglucosamine pyrophosphatase LpxH
VPAWTRPRVIETVPDDQPIWLVSDLHLGDGTPSDAFFGKDRQLTALVRRVQRQGGLLVVAGDALDVQQAWTLTRILRAHQDLLGAMSDLARQGRLVYVVGNHDSDISLYKDILHFRVCDALHVGTSALITHGHENDPFIGSHLEGSNVATRFHHLMERYLDTWLRLPLGEFYNFPNRLMFWMIHKSGLMTLAMRAALERVGVQGWGQRSLDHLDYWARTNMGDPMCMLNPVLRRLEEGPWSWMVCGHSHLPGVVPHPRVPGKHYVNLGSWTFGSSQYAVWDGTRFEVKDWMSGRAYGDELYRPALTGALDEKDFWQWWRENYMGWLRFREGEERRGTLRGWQAFVQDTQGFAQLHEVVDRPALPAPPPELDLTDPGGPQREFAPAPSPHVEGQVDVRPHA